MSGESLPSGVLADELRAWLEFTTKTGVRLPYRPFQLVVEDVLAALASPPPQSTGAPQWLPIESAPRDRRLLGIVDGEVRVIRWGKTSHVPMHGFCLADQGAEDFDLCEPARWMDLPAASQVEPEDKSHG